MNFCSRPLVPWAFCIPDLLLADFLRADLLSSDILRPNLPEAVCFVGVPVRHLTGPSVLGAEAGPVVLQLSGPVV
jgi:hypothetical protein